MTDSIQVPAGCKETGDCMILDPSEHRAKNGKTYEDRGGTDMAIDENDKRYVVTEDDEGMPIFTPENEWEPVDPSGGKYEGDGNFAKNH